MKKKMAFAGVKNQNQFKIIFFFIQGRLDSYTIFIILLNAAFDSSLYWFRKVLK